MPHAIAYQQDGNTTQQVPWDASYVESQNDVLVRFEFGDFDNTKPLIIDVSESFGPEPELRDSPIPEWGAYYGGGEQEEVRDLWRNASYGIATCGRTWAPDFPVTVGTFTGTTSHSNGFVTTFDENYSRVMSTFYGGSGDEEFQAITGGAGLIYVGGWTGTGDLSTMVFDGPPGAFIDGTKGILSYCVLVVAFDAFGIRQWSTLFGPDNTHYWQSELTWQAVAGLDVASGGTLVLGGNYSVAPIGGTAEIPTEFTNQPTIGSMPICGSGYQQDHLAYVSTPFPQPPASEGWLAKFNAQHQLVYSSLFGGSSGDKITDVVNVKDLDQTFLVGNTVSPQGTNPPCTAPPSGEPGFPWCISPGAWMQEQAPPTGPQQQGGGVAFIACFDPGNNLVWCTPFTSDGDINIAAADDTHNGDTYQLIVVGNVLTTGYSSALCDEGGFGFPQRNTGNPFTYPLTPNFDYDDGYLARFRLDTRQPDWITAIGACYPVDVSADEDEVFVAADRVMTNPNAQPLMDAVGFYADIDPQSVGHGLLLGFNHTGQFYGSCYGGNGEEWMQAITIGNNGRLYVACATVSSGLMPLTCPPEVDPLQPPWCVDNLMFQGADLFYGQVKLDLMNEPVGTNERPSATENTVFVYPNPASGTLTVLLSEPLRASASVITINDAFGRNVGAFPCDARNGSNTVGVSNLVAGWYVLVAHDRAGKVLGRVEFTVE